MTVFATELNCMYMKNKPTEKLGNDYVVRANWLLTTLCEISPVVND